MPGSPKLNSAFSDWNFDIQTCSDASSHSSLGGGAEKVALSLVATRAPPAGQEEGKYEKRLTIVALGACAASGAPDAFAWSGCIDPAARRRLYNRSVAHRPARRIGLRAL